MNEEESYFLTDIESAIDLCASGKLFDAVSDFSEFCFKDVPDDLEGNDEIKLSNDFLNKLFNIIRRDDFLNMDDSFKLFLFFQNDWGRFNLSQRNEIYLFLSEIYGLIKDNTSHLVISEIYGEYFLNNDSLLALNKLKNTKNEVARAHIAHGFKCLILNSDNLEVIRNAKIALSGMAQDSSKVVKAEVASVLAEI